MTKLEAGPIDICNELVDVGDVTASALARAKISFPERRTEVALPKWPIIVKGDSRLLQQVVFNLVDNAHKYSPKDTITSIKLIQNGANAELSVSDEGIGIPRSALTKVFEKFYRVADTDGRAAGTGLGLSIADALVRAMGGTIRAESPVIADRGTRIIVTLPAHLPGIRPDRGKS